MKLVTFRNRAGQVRPGVLVGDDRVFDIGAATARDGGEALGDMLAVITAGRAGLARIAAALAQPGETNALGGVTMLAPLPRPPQIRACGN